MIPDLIVQFSVAVIVSIALGALLGTVLGRIAWWQGWTDDNPPQPQGRTGFYVYDENGKLKLMEDCPTTNYDVLDTLPPSGDVIFRVGDDG